MATVVASSHPLLADREVLRVPVAAGETLWRYLDRLGLPPADLVAGVWRNGVAVTRDAWHRTFVADGDYIAVRPVAMGDDSDPATIILTIAVAVAAAYTGGLAAGFFAEGSVAGLVAGGVASGVVSIAGSLLIAALVPPRTPQGRNSLEAGSPSYSLSGARNRARPYQPMLVVLGRHRVVADIAAQPYTQYIDGEQHFYGLYHFGLSDVALSDFRIGNTPVSEYDEAETEVSNADGVVSGMYRNVDTIGGADLTLAAGWVQRTTSIDTHRIEVDLDALIYQVDPQTGELKSKTVRLDGEYRAVGATAWTPFFSSRIRQTVAWFWSLGRDEIVSYTSDDIAAPIFGYREYDWDLPDPALHTVGDTVVRPGIGTLTWTQRVPSAQDTERHPALRPFITVPDLVISNASTDPIRRTYHQVVTPGQYEVRIQRTSSEGTAATTQDSVTWSALRSFQVETGDWYGQTRVALRIRASGQLQGTVDTFNAIAAARVETGATAFTANPATTTLAQTSNPAYLYAHVARGRRHPDTGEVLYGAGLDDAQIDFEALQRWHDWCVANDLHCDMVLDGELTLYDALTRIAQCGRAVPTWQTGKLGVVADAADQAPVAVFGMPNIIAGSFRVDYVAQNLADEIVAQFTDEDEEYERRELRVRAPGIISPLRSIDIEFFGVTRRAQVAREANLTIARQAYHRRRVHFDTDLEGWVCEVGDVIALSHDLTSWGYSGRAIALHDNGTQLTGITLNRTVPIAAGTHYITLRDGAGQRETFEIATPAGDADRIDFVAGPSLWPLPTGLVLDIVWMLDPDPTPGKLAKIVGVRPSNDAIIAVECIDELPEYYAYELAPSFREPPPDYIGRPARVTAIQFTEQLLDRTGLTRVMVTLEAQNTEVVLARYRINGGAWNDQPLLSDLSFHITARTDDRIEVDANPDAVVKLRGAWTERAGAISATHTVVGRSEPPSDVEQFRVERDGRTGLFTWLPVPDVDLAHYEIRRGDTWANSEYIGRTLDTRYMLPQADEGQYLIRAVDTAGLLSPNPATVSLGIAADANIVATRDERALGWVCGIDNVSRVLGGVTLGTNIVEQPWAGLVQPWASMTAAWARASLVRDPASTSTSGSYTSCPLDVGRVTSFRFALRTAAEPLAAEAPWASNTTPWVDQSRTTHNWFGPRADAGSVGYEMRFSDDGTTWTAWESYQSRQVTARYAQARAVFAGSADTIPVSPLLTEFTLLADVPERRVLLEDVAVAPGGTAFALSPSFFALPTISVAIQQGAVGDTYTVTTKTRDSVTVELFNAAGGSIGGLIDLIAIGY